MLDPGIDRKAVKQPTQLLRSKILQFRTLPRPLEPAFSCSFVQQKKAVSFPYKGFDPVRLPSAEQKYRSCSVRIKIELLLYPGGKAVDPFAQIRIAALF